jgi:DNA-binding transcriptional ArsR family regulator
VEKVLWWLIAGSKGGVNRARIINALHERPYNANKLAEKLNLDYKTVRYHIKILEDNKVIKASGGKYGAMYFLSSQLEDNYELFKHIWNEIEDE